MIQIIESPGNILKGNIANVRELSRKKIKRLLKIDYTGSSTGEK